MLVEPIVRVASGSDAQTSVDTLIKVTDNAEIVRWMEFPNSLLLFLLQEIRSPERSMPWTPSKEPGT
jgi:hypothetical protein